MRLCRRNIEEGHTTAGDAAHREDGVQHAGRVVVCRVPGLAGDLQQAVTTGQGLADARAVAAMRNDSCW
jgi:hypothetical protein